MARAFLREDGRYVGILDPTERTILHGLMEQTRVLLSPEVESTGDTFDDLVASMGLSLGGPDEPGSAAAQGGSGAAGADVRAGVALELLPELHAAVATATVMPIATAGMTLAARPETHR